MNKEFYYKIDNIFNIFSSDSLSNIKNKYHLNTCYSLNQIHSDIVCIVDNNYINNTTGDAMITNKQNIPLVIKTADCIPILLYDTKKKVIGVVHSGWKGVIKEITENTVNKMQKDYQTNASDIVAYIYPSIKKCHFEVDKDVYDQFKNKIPDIKNYTAKKGHKYFIDLQTIIKDNLNKLGINKLYDESICTYCQHQTFHSYRYNHTDKRNYLIAMIKE